MDHPVSSAPGMHFQGPDYHTHRMDGISKINKKKNLKYFSHIKVQLSWLFFFSSQTKPFADI